MAGCVVVAGLLLAGCAEDTFTVAPAAADRPVIWLRIVNGDDALTSVRFSGTTRNRPGVTTLDVNACTAGVWSVPIEAVWQLEINGQAILRSSEVRPVQVDNVASIEVDLEGIGRATGFIVGGRPPDPPPPVGCG